MAKKTDKASGETKRTRNQPITAKQSAFAQAYVETGNASEAYRRVYNAGNMTDATVWSTACVLLKNHKVAARVAQLQAEKAKDFDVTIEYLTNEYREAIALAKQEKQAAALSGAITALGKLHGLVTDKHKVESDNRHHHSSEPVSPFDEWLAEVVGDGAEGETSDTLPN